MMEWAVPWGIIVQWFLENLNPNVYLTDDYTVVDLETTNKEKGSALFVHNRIIVGVTKRAGEDARLWHSSGDLKEYLAARIQEHDFIVAQNAKFELQWFHRMGLALNKILVYDTMIGEYVLLGNRKKPLGLGSIAKRRGFGGKAPFIDICMKAGVCPSEMPSPLLNKRCLKDVVQTEQIFLQQRQELSERSQLKTLYTRCIFTPVLADMETRGIYLDGGKVETTYRDYIGRLAKCSSTLEELTGGINLRSSKQKAEFIYGTLGFSEFKDRRGNPIRTPGGSPKTDTATLGRFKARNKQQRTFLQAYSEFNKASSALSKNLDFFLGVVREKSGVFFGQFNQTIAQTHRLSSSGRPLEFDLFPGKRKSVQFQNLPKDFKHLFTARKKGWSLWEADGAQLEFRVAAHLGKDEVATAAIREGFDVHQFTADTLTSAGQPTEREDAKPDTFKPLFGGQSGTKAQVAYYTAFREKYSGISSTQAGWTYSVLRHKQLTIPSGLTFFWPDTEIRNNYITNTPNIFNYPIQSYATADIIPISVTYLWHKMQEANLESFLVNTIHDSAIAEVHPDEVEVMEKLAFAAFTDDVYNYLYNVYDDAFTVPLGAEVKLGTHWSVGKATLHTMEPPTYTNT